MYPENSVAKQLLAPYPRILGRGFERVSLPDDRPSCIEDQTPAEQDRSFRLHRRIAYQNELYNHARVLVDRGSVNIRLVSPSHSQSAEHSVKARQRHDEMFDAESAVLSAVQQRIIHPDLSAMYLHALWSVRNQIRGDILRHALKKARRDLSMWRVGSFLDTLDAIRRGKLTSDSGFIGGKFVSMTKLPLESRGSRSVPHRSGLPYSASDLVSRSMFSQHRSDTWDDVTKPRFAEHAPLELAPTIDALPDHVQETLSEQCNLYCHTDELGLRYWYHGSRPEIKHYVAVIPTVDRTFVLPQTFGKRCVQPSGTVDYQRAQPREVQIYVRPLIVEGEGTSVTVLPIPTVHDRSFEEDRLTHWVFNQGVNQSGVASSSHEGLNPQGYSIGRHIIFHDLKYYPEGRFLETGGLSPSGRILPTGSQSSAARLHSGSSRPSVKRSAPTPTPSVSSTSRAARTGAPAAPASKPMPRRRPAPRTLAVATSSSDSDSMTVHTDRAAVR